MNQYRLTILNVLKNYFLTLGVYNIRLNFFKVGLHRYALISILNMVYTAG